MRPYQIVLLLLVIFVVFYYWYENLSSDFRTVINGRIVRYRWKKEYGDLNGPDISAIDPRVITKIKVFYLMVPLGLRKHIRSTDYNQTEGAITNSLSAKRRPSQQQLKLSKWWPSFSSRQQDDESRHDMNLYYKLTGGGVHRQNGRLVYDDYDPSMGQSQLIRKIFSGYSPGNGNHDLFFIECGALDGETRSNTLYLERNLNWTGLLIEADPSNFAQMIEKKRKNAFLTQSCLSTQRFPIMVSFEQNSNQGRISEQFSAGYVSTTNVDVQCFPFESFMIALNRRQVDYFSLDVEGAELSILKTIPFDKFHISTLSVEFIHDKEGKVAIRDFMSKQGYFVLDEVTHPDWLANDFIFVKEDFFQSLSDDVKSQLNIIKENYERTSVLL